jgi:hypothetical protein
MEALEHLGKDMRAELAGTNPEITLVVVVVVRVLLEVVRPVLLHCSLVVVE